MIERRGFLGLLGASVAALRGQGASAQGAPKAQPAPAAAPPVPVQVPTSKLGGPQVYGIMACSTATTPPKRMNEYYFPPPKDQR